MQDEAGLLSSVVETVFQSLAYGLFVVLAVASTRLLVSRQGWKSRQGTIMLGMIWLMLILSSLEWTMSLVFTLSQIMSSDSMIGNVHPLHDLLTTVGKINYAIADSVLIWRAWVLCRSEYRMVLWVCSFFLVLIAIAIIFRLVCNANPQDRIPPALTHALDVSQAGMLLVSTVTNTLSTGIVGVYVWKYRQLLRTAMSRDRTTLGLGVLLLIVESGVLYTTFVFFSIIGSVIRLPTGTIGDVSGDILIHIAVSMSSSNPDFYR
ncbi:hypothetical protein PHLGIDRAFT_122580 [Phlebiopsis gigantea 11061_1 CR5-6]|uniref:Uncharacterized protein n=1 Tax=Phlebiopsis gigantea (strain 11061_1 CR5-6) TaxID=745531 RepID=A0A0C3NCR8_PHLG1|nr:hypothetical protein PHLGIDRAFT_122580 [Phlebiopsis gigantea 11061_1 CR5-6]